MLRTRSTVVLLALWTLLCLCQLGCRSASLHKEVPAFSTAVSTAMTNTQTAFEVVEAQFHRAAVTTVINKYDQSQPIVFETDIAPFLAPDQLEARLTVLKGLQRYGELLYVLTGDGQLDALDESTTKLGGALQNLNKNTALGHTVNSGAKQIVTDDQLAAFTTAVNAIGRALIEWKRNEAIVTAIPAMDKNVETVCNILIEDIGESDSVPGLRNSLKLAYNKEMQARDRYVSNNIKGFSAVEKRTEIEAIIALYEQRKAADQTLAAVRSTLMKLRTTHSAMSKAVVAKNSRIDEVSVLVAQLKAEGERVAEYYKNVRSALSE